MGIANITNNILTDSGILVSSLPSGSGVTNELTYWTSSSVISSLTIATYPSLTELSYVKGITSSVQTQLNAKQDTLNGTGFIKAVGTVISYDNSTYLTANQSITLSGAVTGTGTTAITTTLANSIVGISNLSATGTPDSTTYLRGDNTWATVSGGGSMAIGGSITGAIAGSVLFAGTSGLLQQDNSNFFWDDTNNRLGIGTSAPSFALEVKQTLTDAWITASRGSNTVHAGFLFNPNGTWSASNALWNFALYRNTNNLQYWAYDTVSDKIVMTMFGGTYNVLIAGGAATATDAGYKLDVAGTGRYQDNLLVSKNQNAGTNIEISNTTNGTASQAYIAFTSDATSGQCFVGKRSNTYPLTGLINLADMFVQNITKGDLIILNSAQGSIKLAAGGSSTAQLTILNNGNITQTVNQNASTIRIISNTTSGTASQALLQLTSDASSGSGQVGKFSTTTTPYKILASKDTYIYNGTVAGDIAILNDFASGTIKMAAGGSSIAHVTIGTTGLTTFATGIVYKRLNPTTTTVASTATLTPDISVGDFFTITAQAVGLSVANPAGVPVEGQKMTIRIEDNGTAQAITWSGTQFRASTDLTLPTSTTALKTMYLGFLYNATDTKWDLVSKINNF